MLIVGIIQLIRDRLIGVQDHQVSKVDINNEDGEGYKTVRQLPVRWFKKKEPGKNEVLNQPRKDKEIDWI